MVSIRIYLALHVLRQALSMVATHRYMHIEVPRVWFIALDNRRDDLLNGEEHTARTWFLLWLVECASTKQQESTRK